MDDLAIDVANKTNILRVDAEVSKVLDVLRNVVSDENEVAVIGGPWLENSHDLVGYLVGRWECACTLRVLSARIQVQLRRQREETYPKLN